MKWSVAHCAYAAVVLTTLGVSLSTRAQGPSSVDGSSLDAPSAVADLRERFRQSADALDRQGAASSLLLIGQGSEEHLGFLLAAVEEVIEEDAPFPLSMDADGHVAVSEELVAWAEVEGIDIGVAQRLATVDQPTAVLYLGMAHRVEALDSLQRALRLRNAYVTARAAEGIARLECSGANVEKIVSAAKAAPAGLRVLFAKSLLYCGLESTDVEAKRLLAGWSATEVPLDEVFGAMRESVRLEKASLDSLLALRREHD